MGIALGGLAMGVLGELRSIIAAQSYEQGVNSYTKVVIRILQSKSVKIGIDGIPYVAG